MEAALLAHRADCLFVLVAQMLDIQKMQTPVFKTCEQCGGVFIGGHICHPPTPFGWKYPSPAMQAQKQITEDDIRRIVREEIERAKNA